MQYDAILERACLCLQAPTKCHPSCSQESSSRWVWWHVPLCSSGSACTERYSRSWSPRGTIPHWVCPPEWRDAPTCLSSICIKGSVITKIGMPSASQITALCSKLKNLPWHWNTTSGDESERTSTGIDEPEHPDAYWCILMHPAICQLLFVIVYYSKSHGTSLRYQKAQYPPQRAPTVFSLLESLIL